MKNVVITSEWFDPKTAVIRSPARSLKVVQSSASHEGTVLPTSRKIPISKRMSSQKREEVSPRGEIRHPSACPCLLTGVPQPAVLVTHHGAHQPGARGRRVVDVVLAPVLTTQHCDHHHRRQDHHQQHNEHHLLVHRPLVVAVDHPVDAEHVRLVFLHHALRLQYKG